IVAQNAQQEVHVAEMRVPRSAQPASRFDEEVDELEDLEEWEHASPPPTFSPEQLDHAKEKIRTLRETQGTAIVIPARLQALRNAADAEVSNEQLQELVAGIWNLQTLKKLKVDQAEALISWTKEDSFVEEVAIVLSILEEEHHARSNG